MLLKLVPMGIEGVLVRLMQERCGSGRCASIEEWRRILNDRVVGERKEILELIESERANGNLFDGNHCLRSVAAAIRSRGTAMSNKEGTLRMQPSGRWAVCWPEREPVEITSGELFRVEFAGQLKLTRIEYQPGDGYYSVDIYSLRDGLRAAIGEHG